MKLVVCVIHNRDKNRLTDEMVKAGFKFTVIGSSGGFLREGNTTFFVGVEDERVDELRSLIGANCESREQLVNVTPFDAVQATGLIPNPVQVPVGGAVAFVLNVEEFMRF